MSAYLQKRPTFGGGGIAAFLADGADEATHLCERGKIRR
jgi:hypothetical protein